MPLAPRANVPPRTPPSSSRHGADVVALVLAIGICTALNVMTCAVLYDALFSAAPGLSENATQILTGWGGGIIGIIGALVGYRVGQNTPPAATSPAARPAE